MIDPAWIALIGTVSGGIGLKFAEHYLGRSSQNREAHFESVRDYRAEILELAGRVEAAEKQESEWREKYYKLREEMLDAIDKREVADRAPPVLE